MGSTHDADRLVETHTAWVMLLGEHAYKLKKPVRLDFLDFSTREARAAAAHREVELNRRLAPDVYLGVADVTGPDGSLCDHVVVMRRMPEDRRLSTLVAQGRGLDDDIREIARVVAAFHTHAATSPEIAAVGTPAAILDKLERDLKQLRHVGAALLDTTALDSVATAARRYVTGRAPLFEQRVAQRLVRDGHGDLLAGDIFCLDDGPRILDCIEFDDRLRYGDVLADVAFLAMDLERLGNPTLSGSLFRWYQKFSNEHHPPTLADYYVATRALIRSKVACIRATQGDPEAANEAKLLLELAARHLDAARIRLVVIGGTPGTGKSTLAAGLAEATGWTVLRSDEVRKDIAGPGRATPSIAPLGGGIYDETTTTRTYTILLERARAALAHGQSVILDASWSRAAWRDQAARLAHDTVSDFVAICCDAPPEIATARVARRLQEARDVSDATPEVAAAMRARFDPWPEAIRVATGGPVTTARDAALRLLAVS